MTKDDLKNAILDTEDEWIGEALPKSMGRKKRPAVGWRKPALIAAACATVFLAAILLWPKDTGSVSPGKVAHAYALAEAQYPAMTNGDSYYVGSFEEWLNLTEQERNKMFAEDAAAKEEFNLRFDANKGNGASLKPFLQKAIVGTLKESKGENRLSAPLNLYFALAMLSEAAEGETRQEILDLIGADSQKTLREQVKKVWLANYYDNGYVKCILADSLWLSDSCSYHQKCVDTISDSCFASVFRGTMGSAEYDEMLHNWINEETGNLLQDSVSQLKMDPDQAAELVSTLFFQDMWKGEFKEDMTRTRVFHAASGDKKVEFMHQTDNDAIYFYADHFSAYGKTLKDSGAVMYFILPDEGMSMDELLEDGQLQAFLTDETAVHRAEVRINLAVPKFDIAEDRKLCEVLKSLGVQKVFEAGQANLGGLLTHEKGAYVSDVLQGARIIVDEKGVKAAAYVAIPLYGAGPPSGDIIDFVLDRPFLFVLRSRDGLPLLSGVVNAP